MAVYTELPDHELAGFLTAYDIGPAISCKGIAEGVENSNFLLRTPQGNFIITLFEKRVHEEDLPYFIGLMDHCHHRGFLCPSPVPNRNGQKIGRLCQRPATIVTFLDGIWPKQPQLYHCAALGEAIADFHIKASGFSLCRKNALGLQGWTKLVQKIGDDARKIDSALPILLDEEIKFLERHWPDNLPVGHIHGDLFPDNVFFIGPVFSGFIDFYFSCTDFLAYDLAVALNAWCFDASYQLNYEKAQSLLHAYQKTRPLQLAEKEALLLLSRGAALRFLLTRTYDWLHPDKDALVMPKDPMEYVHKLTFFRTSYERRAFFLNA